MPTPDAVVRALRERGELWEPLPGVVGLRGGARAAFDMTERAIARVARVLAPDRRT